MWSINRILRNTVVAMLYALIAAGSLVLSYILRYDFAPPGEVLRQMGQQIPFFVAVQLIAMFFMGQFDSLLTFFSVPDFKRILKASLLAGLVFGSLWVFSGGELMPARSIMVLNGILFLGLVSSLRLLLRHGRERWESNSNQTKDRLETVAIIGAGEAGARLAQRYLAHSGHGLKPMVFLDDDVNKWGQQLHGIPIVGGPIWLIEKGQSAGIRRAIIAMPSASRMRLRTIIEKLEGKGIRLDTVQSYADLLQSNDAAARLRPIQIDDLLGRDPAELNSEKIREMLSGRVAVVTGAGGSIGSELCRQILHYAPAKLLLIEQSEGQLFLIEQELIGAGFKQLIVPLVADISDTNRIRHIFAEHQPAILFHAAAHKHVPMMESQPVAAIKNNALGTARLAQNALDCGVRKFVLISTDKAINPTSVMGAAKRMAEMFIQALQAANPGKTHFISVRFGNVLGSSGSVVPTFQKQIANGGPVTVTHPEMTRYFMTIPEAVGLVLQSGMMGSGGEIFLLDMGKPVKIVDLARKLILLQGLKPDEDISIQFSGLRPGEKMFEELSYNSEKMKETGHAKVFRLFTTAPQLEAVQAKLAELESKFAEVTTDDLKRQMTGLVPEYTPNYSQPERMDAAKIKEAGLKKPTTIRTFGKNLLPESDSALFQQSS